MQVRCGDGTLGWPEEAPFDAILVSAGAPDVPHSLVAQLRVGGRLVLPVGPDPRSQVLVRVTRTGEHDTRRETIAQVRFVPLIGEHGRCVSAVTDVELSVLGHDVLGPLVEDHTGVALAFLHQLAERLRRTNEVVGDLVFSDVPGRVAKQLIDLADRFGRTADDGVHVHHDLTQEELAQLVGASRETVNKALADFASRGWLRLEPRSVVIMDIERLSRRAR